MCVCVCVCAVCVFFFLRGDCDFGTFARTDTARQNRPGNRRFPTESITWKSAVSDKIDQSEIADTISERTDHLSSPQLQAGGWRSLRAGNNGGPGSQIDPQRLEASQTRCGQFRRVGLQSTFICRLRGRPSLLSTTSIPEYLRIVQLRPPA